MTWKLSTHRRCWATKAHDLMHIYQGMEGRIPIPELIAAFEEAGVDWRKVQLNFATATWDEPPTTEEIDAQAERDARQAARTEAWERETLVRLTEKYKTA